MSTQVQDHYGSANIVARILAAVPWSAADGTKLLPSQLFPFDQLHGRELMATKDHAALMKPARDAWLLDIGSGIGGPARYFASTYGTRVSGVDLTPAFVGAANELTDLCGMAGQVTCIQADAATLPFPDQSFDHAYCFYVGMNLPDKSAVLAECFRVMKPGASLIWTEVTAGPTPPVYPLPWARATEASHVEARDALVERLSKAGFDVQLVQDETDAHVELARRMMASGHMPSPEQQQANQIVLGPDFVDRRKNYIHSLSEGSIASTLIVAHKPLPAA